MNFFALPVQHLAAHVPVYRADLATLIVTSTDTCHATYAELAFVVYAASAIQLLIMAHGRSLDLRAVTCLFLMILYYFATDRARRACRTVAMSPYSLLVQYPWPAFVLVEILPLLLFLVRVRALCRASDADRRRRQRSPACPHRICRTNRRFWRPSRTWRSTS